MKTLDDTVELAINILDDNIEWIKNNIGIPFFV